MKLELKLYPDNILRQQCKKIIKVKKKHQDLATAMHWYMRQWKGLGLAAPQVGRDIQLFIVDTYLDDKINPIKRTMFNPKIIDWDQNTVLFSESCLSFPGKKVDILRPNWAVVKYLNENGEEIEERFEGLAARVVMHERDHLDGILLIDKEK